MKDKGIEKNNNSINSTSEFISLMSTNQFRIYAYIMSMVGNVNDADDIMQETSTFMWHKFTEFEDGTDFVSWGISIAYYKVKEFRRKKDRVKLSDEILEQLHKKSYDRLQDTNHYIDKLQKCLTNLPPADFDLIKLHYMAGNSIKKISMRINITVQAVYMRLSKIHGMLGRCIKRSLIEEI